VTTLACLGAMLASPAAANRRQAYSPVAALPAQGEPWSALLPALARPPDNQLRGWLEAGTGGTAPTAVLAAGQALLLAGDRLVDVAGGQPAAPPLPGAGRAAAALADGSVAVAVQGFAGAEPRDALVVVVPGAAGAGTRRVAALDGLAVALAARGAVAYAAVADPPQVQVVDLGADPPTTLARVSLGEPTDLELDADLLWVASAGAVPMVTALRIGATSEVLEAVSSLAIPTAGGGWPRLALAGGRLLVASGGVDEVDVADPTRPRYLGPIDPPTACLTSAFDVAAAAPSEIVVMGNGCLEWRSRIGAAWEVDRSATFNRPQAAPPYGAALTAGGAAGPVAAYGVAGGATDWSAIPPHHLELPGEGGCVAAAGDRLVALAGDAVWTVTPRGGRLAATLPARLLFAGAERCALAPSGPWIAVAADDLFTVVVGAGTEAPQARRAARIGQLNGAVAADARRAFLTAGADGLLVRALDPADTVRTGVVRTAGEAHDVAASAGYLFVADGTAGLTVLDAGGTELPVTLGSVPLEGDARGVHVAGGRAAVTLVPGRGNTRWWQGNLALAVLDVAEPRKPELLARIDLPGASAGRPFIDGERVWVPAGDRLHRLDGSRLLRWAWTGWGPAVSVAAAGGTTVVAMRELGLGRPAGP
jgi:hypothetical protein